MPVPSDLLTTLEPIAALSPGRVDELAAMCAIETVSQGLNPFRMNVVQSEQLLYLLKGELKISLSDGCSEILHGGSANTRHAIVADKAPLQEAVAITDIQILRIDADLLDIMLTWDQLAGYEKSGHAAGKQERSAGQWMESTGVFSAESLKRGVFQTLPPENVEKMFQRMERILVNATQKIICQGDEGDYYYLIENGTAVVTRASQSEDSQIQIAELNAGAAFGEEALASGNKRNANVIMKTDGVLLRLGKSDFVELLQKPLLHRVSVDEARQLIQNGAQLLDVRTPNEFNLKHVPGAMSTPLHNIRSAMPTLSKEKNYITYCQTGRRASAAAFIMAQSGYRVMTLANTPS